MLYTLYDIRKWAPISFTVNRQGGKLLRTILFMQLANINNLNLSALHQMRSNNWMKYNDGSYWLREAEKSDNMVSLLWDTSKSGTVEITSLCLMSICLDSTSGARAGWVHSRQSSGRVGRSSGQQAEQAIHMVQPKWDKCTYCWLQSGY